MARSGSEIVTTDGFLGPRVCRQPQKSGRWRCSPAQRPNEKQVQVRVSGSVVARRDLAVSERAARQASWLFLVAGVLTIVTAFLPSGQQMDRPLVTALGVVAVALGGAVRVLPW